MKFADTSKFTKEDIGLLLLCKNNPGPNISEMFEFAESYELGASSIRTCYIRLLSENLLCPFGGIDPNYYLPAYCLITDDGQTLLKTVELQEPEKLPKIDPITWIKTRRGSDGTNGLSSWPKFRDIEDLEILKLADLYTSFARRTYEQSHAYEAIEQYFAAAIGYSRLGDALRLQTTLGECFRIIEDLQDAHKLLEYITKVSNELGDKKEALAVLRASMQNYFGDLLEDEIPSLENSEIAHEVLSKIILEAEKYGMLYEFNIPKTLYFSKQMNVIDDLISDAFELDSKSIFQSAVDLLYNLVQQASNMIVYSGGDSKFDEKLSYSDRVDLASRICILLEQLSGLVFCNKESKEKALSLAKQMISSVIQLAVQPVTSMRSHSSGRNRNIFWTFELLNWRPERSANVIYILATDAEKILSKGVANENKVTKELKEALNAIEVLITDKLGESSQRTQLRRGQLTEFAVMQYFIRMGFTTEKASSEYDQKKVDLIAEISDSRFFIQVKSGKIAAREIKKIARNISDYQDKDAKKLVMVVIADEYPSNSEFVRQGLEDELNLKIMFIHKYQILENHPEFKRTIG